MYFIIIFCIIALDQFTKFIIVSNLELNHTIPVVDGIFHITYIRNYGAAFSILQNKQVFLLIVTGIVLLGLVIFIIKKASEIDLTMGISLAMIIGGGFGNLIDRVRFAYVIDFIDFRVFPIFNIADISVVCGCILLVFYVFYIDSKKNSEEI